MMLACVIFYQDVEFGSCSFVVVRNYVVSLFQYSSIWVMWWLAEVSDCRLPCFGLVCWPSLWVSLPSPCAIYSASIIHEWDKVSTDLEFNLWWWNPIKPSFVLLYDIFSTTVQTVHTVSIQATRLFCSNKQHPHLSRLKQQKLFLAHATCPLWVGWRSWPRLFSLGSQVAEGSKSTVNHVLVL